MKDHNASATETYRFTSEGITELTLDTYAATFIFTMRPLLGAPVNLLLNLSKIFL